MSHIGQRFTQMGTWSRSCLCAIALAAMSISVSGCAPLLEFFGLGEEKPGESIRTMFEQGELLRRAREKSEEDERIRKGMIRIYHSSDNRELGLDGSGGDGGRGRD